MEKPSPLTLAPHDFANIKANVKVASTENGIIFGNIGKRNHFVSIYHRSSTSVVCFGACFPICANVLFCPPSLRCVGSCERQKLRRPQWHPHWHHGLHPTSFLHRCRIQTDVGGVWVGKQGKLCISTLRPVPWNWQAFLFPFFLNYFWFTFNEWIKKTKKNMNIEDGLSLF